MDDHCSAIHQKTESQLIPWGSCCDGGMTVGLRRISVFHDLFLKLIKPVGIDAEFKTKSNKSEKFHILFKTKHEKPIFNF